MLKKLLSNIDDEYAKKTVERPPPVSNKSNYESPIKKRLIDIKCSKPPLFDSVNIKERSDCDVSHIGILFIIVDKFPHEALWRLWLENAPEVLRSRVHIFFHAKFDHKIQSEWIKDRLLQHFKYSPSWGSVQLTETMLGLLHESMESCRSISHACFASESCVPIIPLEELFRKIESQNGSWLSYQGSPNNGYAACNQFKPCEAMMPKECIFKSDQWCLLTRKHAVELVFLSYYLRYNESELKKVIEDAQEGAVLKRLRQEFGGRRHPALFAMDDGGVRVTDEMYIPSMLAILGHIPLLHDLPTTSTVEVFRRRFTFADWSQNTCSPKSFTNLEQSDLLLPAQEGCVFMRKVTLPLGCSESNVLGCSLLESNEEQYVKSILQPLFGVAFHFDQESTHCSNHHNVNNFNSHRSTSHTDKNQDNSFDDGGSGVSNSCSSSSCDHIPVETCDVSVDAIDVAWIKKWKALNSTLYITNTINRKQPRNEDYSTGDHKRQRLSSESPIREENNIRNEPHHHHYHHHRNSNYRHNYNNDRDRDRNDRFHHRR